MYLVWQHCHKLGKNVTFALAKLQVQGPNVIQKVYDKHNTTRTPRGRVVSTTYTYSLHMNLCLNAGCLGDVDTGRTAGHVIVLIHSYKKRNH